RRYEVGGDFHILTRAARVRGDDDIDGGTVGGCRAARDSCWNVADQLFEPVTRNLFVPGCF
ncbi:MAG: hypothetical protein J2P27_06980, partial [Actinobacteria bacterium]|nr:hypothetical protein [Actinomycetota bacterium]